MRTRCLLLVCLLSACVELEPSSSSGVCEGCVPTCALGVDANALDAAADRLGCDAELVSQVWPRPGLVVRELRPEVGVELTRAPRSDATSGQGCDGPIRLRRVGEGGRHPEAVVADILTHASIGSLPLWPKRRDCVPARWSIDDTTLRLTPVEPLERFVWYEAQVDQALELAGPGLCSELAWRFMVSPCGNGVLDVASTFTDWVCMGRPEAERGWFGPYSEECDDGNDENKDGCVLCVCEAGWRCDEAGCHTRCGDAILAGDEECDYGIHQPDGCSAECRVEPGYACDFNGCRRVASSE